MFNELEYSIKSVRKNYKGDARCFVIGDDPGLDVAYIPAQRIETYKNNPREADVNNKLSLVANSDEIGDFVLMCDDLFINQPIDDEELRKAYGRGEIVDIFDYVKKRRGSMDYKRSWRATYEFATVIRYPKGQKTYDWECHLPRFIVKDRLKYIMKTFDLKNNPKIVTGLHDAYEVEETELITPDLQADLWTHRPGMDFDVELKKRYMNLYDDAIMPELIEKMKILYD